MIYPDCDASKRKHEQKAKKGKKSAKKGKKEQKGKAQKGKKSKKEKRAKRTQKLGKENNNTKGNKNQNKKKYDNTHAARINRRKENIQMRNRACRGRGKTKEFRNKCGERPGNVFMCGWRAGQDRERSDFLWRKRASNK